MMKLLRYLRLWYGTNLKGVCPRCGGKTYWLPSEYERCSDCNWDEYEDGFWGEIKGKQDQLWSQVGGYCYMCGKPTDKQTEKIERVANGVD